MVNFMEDLLLQFSIVLFLGLFYNFVHMQKLQIRPKPVFMISVFITLMLTASFPMQLSIGIEYDLKFVPIFLSYFYLGPNVSIGFILALALHSALDGWGHLFFTLLNYAVIFLLFTLVKKYYAEATVVKKIMVGISIYLGIMLTKLAVLLNSGNEEQLLYLIVFALASFSALGMTIYIIEMTEFQRQTVIELHKAEKLSSISQLAASVAHEVRNPITTIRGFMQVLLNEKNITEQQMMYITISLQELDRAQVIINNFLAMARPNDHIKDKIDLTQLLREITEFMKPYSHFSNIAIIDHLDEGLEINADPHEIRQIIINLVKNGIEAMPEGGNFYIEAEKAGDYVRIQIKDEGIGMSKKQVSKLGTPYYSTKEKGTGLGLMICYEIVHRMNGKIEVESEMGKGTTFTLFLPASV